MTEYDYACNIWHQWSPLMTHSLRWYCEAIIPTVLLCLRWVLHINFPRRRVCS